MNILKEEPLFLVVDLFCGAGGTTTGFEMTNGLAKVIACINHDKNAIKSHWLNHPDVKHFEEDIRTLNLQPLIDLVNVWRKRYPNAKLILWASLECTNFSKAKGGLPRDADSRTLADFLLRYIEALNPEIIQIENVVEFMSWGPLDVNGKPERKNNGVDWLRWRKKICKHGYFDEWSELNSADLGAYTSRNRLFGFFSKEQNLICWPEPTHFKNPSDGNLFETGLKWKPVKEVLDLDDEGKSIFASLKAYSRKNVIKYLKVQKIVKDKKKGYPSIKLRTIAVFPKSIKVPDFGMPGKLVLTQGHVDCFDALINEYCIKNNLSQNEIAFWKFDRLSPKTFERVDAGLVKYIAGGKKAFIAKYFSGRPAGKVISIDGPAGAITVGFGQSLVQPCFLAKYHGKGENVLSINGPASTLSTKDRLAKVQAIWLDRNFTNGGGHQSIEVPSGSVLGVPKLNMVHAKFLMNTNYNNIGSDINMPAPTLTASRHHPYIVNPKFILNKNSSTAPSVSIDNPAPTITQRTHYLVNPQWGGNPASIDKPCFTLIARMDKAPPYIVTTEKGEIGIEIYNTDTVEIVRIKRFMAAFGIVDIKMRMLKTVELLKIQGFPADYKLYGTETDQKKFIGNSVVPLVVKSWIESIGERKNNLNAA